MSDVPHDEQDEIPVNPDAESDERGVDGSDDDSPEVSH